MAENHRGGLKAGTQTMQNFPFKWGHKCQGAQRGIRHLLIVSSPTGDATSLSPNEQWRLTLSVFFSPADVADSFRQKHGRGIVSKRQFDSDPQTCSEACCPLTWFRGKSKNKVICRWENPNSKLVSLQRDIVRKLLEKKARLWSLDLLFCLVA